MFTYKDLYTQVVEEIEKRKIYPSADPYATQGSKTQITDPIVFSARNLSADTSVVLDSVANLFQELIPPTIHSGLTVKATDPISNKVVVEAGKGSFGGRIYILNNDVTIEVPFSIDNSTTVFYINLYINGVQIERNPNADRLTLAKVVVPEPGTTNRVKDKKSDDYEWDAHIINLKPIALYGDGKGNLEEDSIDIFRDAIGDILADNLIGNIRLNEDLKIINTAGTLELNSDSLLLKDFNGQTLMKLNDKGTYFFDGAGRELGRFTTIDARVGNILITKNSLQSGNFVAGSAGFRIQDTGNAEFSDVTVRGTIYANTGTIGGFTITSDKLYGTTTGTIQTGANVGAGQNGVKLDVDGLHVYDDVLGRVVFFPSNGDAPTISSGTITEVIYEITTNSIMRTAETVGDGGASSSGILINNTGLYGCENNQYLANANLKVLSTGDVYLKGEIVATKGQIGSVTITADKLSGGLIEGATIRSPIIETREDVPKIRLDQDGFYYQVTPSSGKYGGLDSGITDGFQWGDGTKYGGGVSAYLFNVNYPLLSIMTENIDLADIRLYNRSDVPGGGTGPHEIGDLIVVSGTLQICTSAGSPGTFTAFLKVGDVDRASRALDNLESVAINTSLISDTDNTDDLGSSTKEWKDLYIDGTANIDSLVADTADINAGTVDALIGGTTPDAITGTTIKADTSLELAAGATVTEIENNDALGTSDTKLCTQGNVKAYVDNTVVKLGVGTYQGDGAATLGVTGVGFLPKTITIYAQVDSYFAFKSNVDGTGAYINNATGAFTDDHVISLDADGFTVGDGTVGPTNIFNVNGRTYTYIAFG